MAATGYATGTFYKHFADKGAALLAAYEAWVVEEWDALHAAILSPGSPRQRAERIVSTSADLRARWHGLRQAMQSYMLINDEAAQTYRELQRRQIAILGELRTEISPDTARPPEADVLLVMLIERAVEGIAAGEPGALGLDEATMRRLLVEMVTAALAG